MPRLLPIILMLLCVAVALPVGRAEARKAHPHVDRSRVAMTFKLTVLGRSPRNATYWVAYGPLAGRFGILQMHSIGAGTYQVTATLPAGRTIFSYLAGSGSLRTRMGQEPGAPVVTIRTLGPVDVSQAQLPTVYWRAPTG